ncbi:hypothetical protein ACHAPU_001640 [Fusarium lateritium]
MASNAPQNGSVVGGSTAVDTLPAEPTILSLNRAVGYACDGISARLYARSVGAHGAAGAQTHGQGIASLEAEMAKYKASPNVGADLTDLRNMGSHLE